MAQYKLVVWGGLLGGGGWCRAWAPCYTYPEKSGEGQTLKESIRLRGGCGWGEMGGGGEWGRGGGGYKGTDGQVRNS